MKTLRCTGNGKLRGCGKWMVKVNHRGEIVERRRPVMLYDVRESRSTVRADGRIMLEGDPSLLDRGVMIPPPPDASPVVARALRCPCGCEYRIPPQRSD